VTVRRRRTAPSRWSEFYTTRSEKETIRLAKRLARTFGGREVVLLTGGLGAGKTVFAKGIASGVGVRDVNRVTSPTFTLVNVYEGRHRVFHIDLYRLDDQSEILDLGWEDYLDEGIVIVEWAEKMAHPPAGIRVLIETGPDGERTIIVTREA
jgi:tRNA threonylcarbamoyladenosine biosynthesis protein TsaE